MSMQRTQRRARHRAMGFHVTNARRVWRGLKTPGQRRRYVEQLSNATDLPESYLYAQLDRADPRLPPRRAVYRSKPSRRGWDDQARARMNPRTGRSA